MLLLYTFNPKIYISNLPREVDIIIQYMESPIDLFCYLRARRI